jgi:DNA-binding SARP family transcriptional activator
MRQVALLSHIPLTRLSEQEEQGWGNSKLRVALSCQSSGLPSLHMQLLGGFQLTCGDILITGFERPRLQSLLTYLVLHAGIAQSRTRLAALLWPDSPETQAHTNLRNLLYKLRKLLSSTDVFVRVERHTILWHNNRPWQLDVRDFEGALVSAEQAEREGDLMALQVALEQATALYQGELLPGCYDEWVLPKRERLFQLHLDALERLLHLREREGDLKGSLRVAQRLIHEDPLHEATYRCLMRLYARSGNRSAALRTYHTCAAVLKGELGVGPAYATRQVYERLVQTEPFQPVTAVKRSGSALEA